MWCNIVNKKNVKRQKSFNKKLVDYDINQLVLYKSFDLQNLIQKRDDLEIIINDGGNNECIDELNNELALIKLELLRRRVFF